MQERGGVRVLDDVSADLPARRITALVGPSGAGKTSLLRLLDRLDDPASGTVSFGGRPITAEPVRRLRRRVGFVFQTPTMFPGTIADNLRAAAALCAPGERPPPGGDDGWIEKLLRLVELDPALAARATDGLSGGEKQRVGIARALATSPDALLLDEPTSALDPEVAERLMTTIVRLNADAGLTIVMVTHRLAEARSASGYTVMLEGGRVVEAGDTAALFTRAATARARAYLGAADARGGGVAS